MTNDISSGSSENMTLAKLGLFRCFLYSQDAIKYTPWPCSNCQQKSDFCFCISRFDPHWFYTSGQPKIKKIWFVVWNPNQIFTDASQSGCSKQISNCR